MSVKHKVLVVALREHIHKLEEGLLGMRILALINENGNFVVTDAVQKKIHTVVFSRDALMYWQSAGYLIFVKVEFFRAVVQLGGECHHLQIVAHTYLLEKGIAKNSYKGIAKNSYKGIAKNSYNDITKGG